LVTLTVLVRWCFLQHNRAALTRGVLRLWQRLEERRHLDRRPGEEFRAAVERYRRRCLFGQKLIRAAPFAARAVFREHGWEDGGKARFPFSSPRQGCAVATGVEATYAKTVRP